MEEAGASRGEARYSTMIQEEPEGREAVKGSGESRWRAAAQQETSESLRRKGGFSRTRKEREERGGG